MSEPKRYIFRIRECGCVKPEHLEGKYAHLALIIEETEENYGWVKWDDYARLKAEVEELTGLLKASTYYNTSDEVTRLKAEVERLELEVFAFDRTIKQASCHYDNRLEDIRQLQAQVERLTKAGDNLVYVVTEHPVAEPFVKAWFAAKEGKPRA